MTVPEKGMKFSPEQLDVTPIREIAQEVLSEEVIKDLWEKVCASGSEEDRLKFLTFLGPKLQQVINRKRLELIRPLDELEKTIERKLRDEYTQAKAINNSISSFLVSAAEVAENRDRLLNMMGVTDEKITHALDEADKAVAALVSGSEKAEKGVAVFKENMDKIMKEIKK